MYFKDYRHSSQNPRAEMQLPEKGMEAGLGDLGHPGQNSCSQGHESMPLMHNGSPEGLIDSTWQGPNIYSQLTIDR